MAGWEIANRLKRDEGAQRGLKEFLINNGRVLSERKKISFGCIKR